MTRSAVRLRAATLQDIDAVLAIEREAFSDPWSARSFRELIGRRNVLFEVAVLDAGAERGERASLSVDGSSPISGNPATFDRSAEQPRVVGFSVLYLAGTEGDLANLATAASARHSGVGRRLLAHVLELAQSRGAHTIFLEVRESNSAARALYHSVGFVDVGRRAKYYARPVEDALVLRKELS